jgi:hypothetical protein
MSQCLDRLVVPVSPYTVRVVGELCVGVRQGNHDVGLASFSAHEVLQWILPGATHYLCDSMAVVDGVTFWGSPWTPDPRAGFTCPFEQLATKWAAMPANLHVAMTHNPPYKLKDLAWSAKADASGTPCNHCQGVHKSKSHWGCPALRRQIEAQHPRVHLFGHCHDDTGYLDHAHEGVTLVNACTSVTIEDDDHPKRGRFVYVVDVFV